MLLPDSLTSVTRLSPRGLSDFEMTLMRAILYRSIPLLLAATLSDGAQAATPSTWKPECVGRSTISLPSDVEMAALSYDSFAEEVAGGGARLSESQFKDGQRAGWSRLSYLNGLFAISNELESRQIVDLRSIFSSQPGQKRDYLKMIDTPQSRATVVPDVKSNSPQMMSWSYDSSISYLHRLQNHLLYTAITNDGDAIAESNETFVSLTKNTNYRDLFSIPGGSGVCLPFAFIKDKGSEPRKISISYRIKSQPDVMIVLTEASAERPNESRMKAIKTPESETNDFWTQYEVSQTGKKVSSRWPLNSKNAVEMDGRNGIASFVNITRKDDSKDVGYLALVPGDPLAKVDAPKLRLFVVREANHARAKGIEPISERAFLDLAEHIAASVSIRR